MTNPPLFLHSIHGYRIWQECDGPIPRTIDVCGHTFSCEPAYHVGTGMRAVAWVFRFRIEWWVENPTPSDRLLVATMQVELRNRLDERDHL